MQTADFGEVVLPEMGVGCSLVRFHQGECRELTIHDGDNDIARAGAEVGTVDLDDMAGCKGYIRALPGNLTLQIWGMECASNVEEGLFKARHQLAGFFSGVGFFLLHGEVDLLGQYAVSRREVFMLTSYWDLALG